MQFGLFTGLTGISWSQLQQLWQHIEATGWDAAFVTDHFMPNVPDPVETPWSAGQRWQGWRRSRHACALVPWWSATPTVIRQFWQKWPRRSIS